MNICMASNSAFPAFYLQLVLVVGAKLEVIVDQMALKMKDVNNVTKGTPLVCPSDEFFWFGHPGFVLTLLHYTLFVVNLLCT